jgi:hypothetical protein
MNPKRHVGAWSLVAVLLGPLVIVGCKEEDQCLPILDPVHRPWRLYVSEMERMDDLQLGIRGWLVHATDLDCYGRARRTRYHHVRHVLDIGERVATVVAHEQYTSISSIEDAGLARPYGAEADLPDLDVRIPTNSPEGGLVSSNPELYGTGIYWIAPADRVFAVLFYHQVYGVVDPQGYEPLVIVDCSGPCCLRYHFSLTTHRRRTDCSHAFEGSGSEVGTTLLGGLGGFGVDLASLANDELTASCEDHERLPVEQMADYDVCDFWDLINDPSAFCPCTRVECTCSDPDQDCLACGP